MKFVLLALFLLAGCAGMPNSYDPTKLTAEQLTAMEGSTLTCTTFQGTSGVGMVVYINMSKAAAISGTATIDTGCKTSTTIVGPAAPASGAKQ